MRIGHGYDVHRFTKDRPLILGGIKIPYEKGLLGHSDADVLAHAIMDALLGAAGLGDIGTFFPDTDNQWKDANSITLLGIVTSYVHKEGYEISNIDSTIIAQEPKIKPYIDLMKQEISKAASIDKSQLAIKATTEEGLGFTGAKEGIAAHAVCLLEKI